MNNLQKIQKYLKENNISLFIVNRTDEFLNEYIAPYAERLEWISNFSGSAGRAIIQQNKAFIFIDGRYTFQAHKQVDAQYYNIEHLKDYWKYLENKIEINSSIGIDATLHSNSEIKKIKDLAKKKKSFVKYLKKNPIDDLWNDQPPYPQSQAFIHEEKYAGKSSIDKLHNLQSILESSSIDYYILTSLDSIAWLLNIRGNDILHIPLILSFAIVPRSGKIELFVDDCKITNIKKKLQDIVNFHSFRDVEDYLITINNSVIGMDEDKTAYNFNKICNDNNISIKYLPDPCVYPKAQKNSTELSGARNANIRDGLSVTRFLYWLKNEININKTDEIKAANYLYDLRQSNDLFHSLSFDTISAIDEHAALPHYRVTHETNLSFRDNSVYLVDSGAQYLDGTTDITRTIILGEPTVEQKDRFTRVLKGHIAIASATFEVKTKGSTLDPLARKSLQDIGCDYDHGTGHGIGSFLSVHEGPQRIAKSQGLSDGEIREGMILSNEPGFYKKEEYGIRTENLIVAYKKSDNTLGFETISWAPIDIDLIDINILSSDEIIWLNNYHQKVYEKLGDKLDMREREWLKKVTSPVVS
jgi:Xaa-Pro aminopeptidase